MTNKDAIEWLCAIKCKYIHGGDESYDQSRREAIDFAVERLKEQPDIVRCKDCIWYDLRDKSCEHHACINDPAPDWFCADGERM